MKSWTKTKTAIVVIAGLLLVVIAIALTARVVHSVQASHYPKLAGAWIGELDAQGKKLRVQVNISKTNGEYVATGDSIDQGMWNIPIDKITYDYPAFHLEMKSIGGIYDGKMNETADEISGTWKQDKAAMPLTFKLGTNAISEILSEDDYAPRTGSAVQGFWQGTLSLPGGTALRLNFKIAEPTPGAFDVRVDSLDQGAKNIPTSSAGFQNSVFSAEFAGIDGSFEGSVKGREINGTWKQGKLSLPLKLQRADAAELAQKDADKSYHVPGDDLPGHWKGTLSVRKAKLHLVVNIAKSPDGSLSATMDSLDQGAKDLPATSIQYDAPKVHIEWKGIGGVYDGTLKNKKLSGTWKQGGGMFPLILIRDIPLL